MHSNSDNIEILNHDKTDKAIEEHFESLLKRYQIGLEISMREVVISFLIVLICCITNPISDDDILSIC